MPKAGESSTNIRLGKTFPHEAPWVAMQYAASQYIWQLCNLCLRFLFELAPLINQVQRLVGMFRIVYSTVLVLAP